jgi:hypothetical protein
MCVCFSSFVVCSSLFHDSTFTAKWNDMLKENETFLPRAAACLAPVSSLSTVCMQHARGAVEHVMQQVFKFC